jgi:hypothetical protein
MKRIIKLTESDMVSLIKKVILEQYSPEKLYRREHIVNTLKKGPRELKRYIKDLPSIDCTDNEGNKAICTKIPEVIHVYLQGKY